MSTKENWTLEQQLWQAGFLNVAGIDEAGRGALAGPVVASVVMLPYTEFPYQDSKTLTATKRESYAKEIKARAIFWSVGYASAKEIDQLNVLKATHLAVYRAMQCLKTQPDALVTDYLKLEFAGAVLAPPKADNLSVQVSAASILAKTNRDDYMICLDKKHPEYDFAKNKGYGAQKHMKALSDLGPCDEHRLSFKPVAQQRLF